MAAVKPEIVVIPALYQMDMKLKLVGHFFRTMAAYAAWPYQET
jgi:hypothetical protein